MGAQVFPSSLVGAGAALLAACALAQRYEPRTFLGYACEDDCERQKAGFAWAESHGVARGVQCEVLPRQESRGCLAFLDAARSAELAGFRWGLENEIVDVRLCGGAGSRFEAGCRRAVTVPVEDGD